MKILCIDDDIDDLELLGEVVNAIDPHATCLMSTSGEEGLSLVQAYRPEFIFLDINMPAIDGRLVLTRIRLNPKFNDVKICILSTSISASDCEQYKKMGATYCLCKPTSFDDFKTSVKSIFEKNV